MSTTQESKPAINKRGGRLMLFLKKLLGLICIGIPLLLIKIFFPLSVAISLYLPYLALLVLCIVAYELLNKANPPKGIEALVTAISGILAGLITFAAIVHVGQQNKCSLLVSDGDSALSLLIDTTFVAQNELNLPFMDYNTKGGTVSLEIPEPFSSNYLTFSHNLKMLGMKINLIQARTGTKKIPEIQEYEMSLNDLVSYVGAKDPEFHKKWHSVTERSDELQKAIYSIIKNAGCS